MTKDNGPEPNDFARVLGVLLGVAMVATVIAWAVLALVYNPT
jgi:hypothetical protein